MIKDSYRQSEHILVIRQCYCNCLWNLEWLITPFFLFSDPSAEVPSRTLIKRPASSASVKIKGFAPDQGQAVTTDSNPNSSYSRISTLSLQLPEDGSTIPGDIEKFLVSLGNKLLRAKGYVYIKRKGKHYLLQYAGKRITWEPATYYEGDSYLVLIGLDL